MATDDKTNETSAVPLTTDAAGAASGSAAAQGAGGKEEAKSRFNSALDEAMRLSNFCKLRVIYSAAERSTHSSQGEEVLVATAREQASLDVLRQGQEQRWRIVCRHLLLLRCVLSARAPRLTCLL